MAGRSTLILLAGLLLAASTTSGAWAEEAPPPSAPNAPDHLHGIITHGDSGDILEDFFGSRIERRPPEDAPNAARKYDPAIRWDDRPIRR